MRQLELVAPFRFEMQTVPAPEAGAGNAVLDIAYTGICGSDLHAYRGKHPNVHPPIVLGHEMVGIVRSVGPGADTALVGRRVVVEPGLPCGECPRCREGRGHICDSLRVVGCVGWQGSMAEQLEVPARNLIPLPDGLGLREGATVEPVAVAVHAMGRVTDIRGPVLVVGAGPIGVMVTQTARAVGATRVAVSDPRAERRQAALAFGADAAIDPTRGDMRAAVREALGPDGPQVIFDCVGIARSVADAIRCARKGSRIVIVGVPEDPVPVDIAAIQDWELELVGTLMYQRRDFEAAIAYLARGSVRTEGFVTDVVELEAAPAAFERLATDPGAAMKILVKGPAA